MTTDFAQALHQIAGAIRKGGDVPACPVPFDGAATVALATAAHSKMTADTEEPALLILRDDYETSYGFPTAGSPAHFREGASKCIWFPNRSFSQLDLQALLAAANAAGVAPATLGALWIVEGKLLGDPITSNGQVLRFPSPARSTQFTSASAVSAADIKNAGIGVLMWCIFGADAFLPHGSASTDNFPKPPGPSYATVFKQLLTALGDAGAPGPISTDGGRTGLVAYLKASVSTTAWTGAPEGAPGATKVTSIPASTPAYLSIRVSRECLATLLYIDACLFSVQYRADAQKALAAKHGDTIDLTDSPWVTYVRWNAGDKTFTNLFAAGASSQGAIDAVFGDPPLQLTSAELAAYYGSGTQQIAVSAHGTAVHYKYLHQAIGRWLS